MRVQLLVLLGTTTIDFVETKNGTDTLQDTVGIAYQVLNNSQPNILEDNRERQTVTKIQN